MKKLSVKELNDIQRQILFAFAESRTEDLNSVNDNDYKSYHCHEKIRKFLELQEDYFYLELRNLFRFGYLDLLNEEFYFMVDMPSIPTMFNINDRLNNITNEMLISGKKDKSCLSKYAMLAINTYLLDISKETVNIIEEHKKEIDDVKLIISKHNQVIDEFNSNILTIMAILITVFSIIGLNLGSIKYLNEVLKANIVLYLGTIITINVTLLIVMYALFYLMSKMNSNEEKRHSLSISKTKEFWIIIIVLLILDGILIA
jgi:hypothetical protein